MLQQPPASPGAGTAGPGPTPQPPTEDTTNPPVNPNVPNPNVKPIDPGMLTGSWKASRDDGSAFELTLNNDQTYSWKFAAPKQEPRELSGKFTVEQNVLALQQKEGGALVGQVT